MNPIIFILLCFAAAGLFDKILKNRLGLASSFDKGMLTMGDFMLSVGGFYCIAIAFLNGHASLFENKEMIFCGVLLTSTLGTQARILDHSMSEMKAPFFFHLFQNEKFNIFA